MNTHPSRIVCLNPEATETLCLLGEGQRIVGFSGSPVRLPAEQHGKPRVSVHTPNRIDRICALEPDLVLGFGESHGEVLGGLAQRGLAVHLFNQRSVRGILDMIRVIGGLVGRDAEAAHFTASLEWHIEAIRASCVQEHRPRVYFEEWDEPAITANGWVSELIGIAGGENCFSDLARYDRPEHRVIQDGAEVIRRAPEIIIGAWRGKAFERRRVEVRDGWQHLPAVINRELHEIKSAVILQPGPAALTEGLDALHRIVETWREHRTRMFQTPLWTPLREPVEEGVTERVA